jgi:hypothetical protein
MSRILRHSEVAWSVDIDRVEIATCAVINQILGDGGPDDARKAICALGAVAHEELWLVELCCEAELFANDRPVREPCGLRLTETFT